MLYFLYGTDTRRLQEAKQKIFIGDSASSYSYDLSEPDELSRLKDFLRIRDMFGQTRYASLRNVFASSHSLELFRSDIIQDPSLVLAIIEPTGEKDLQKKYKELWQFLTTKGATVISCPPLAFKDIQSWIKSYVQEHGLAITAPASQQLLQQLGLNQKNAEKPHIIANLQQQLDKCIAYAFSQRTQTITPDIITTLIPLTAELAIFDLVDALGEKNIPRAFSLLHKHLEQLADPYYILSMMLYQFRNLLLVKSLLEHHVVADDIASQTKLHPYVVQKTVRQASRFNLAELKQHFSRLIALEGDLKSGKADEVDSLYLSVLALNRP